MEKYRDSKSTGTPKLLSMPHTNVPRDERKTNTGKKQINNFNNWKRELRVGKCNAVKMRYMRQAKPESPVPDSKPEITTPEPEATPNFEPEPKPNAESSWPEPGPNWPVAYRKWLWAWAVHIYGFAAVFTFLSIIPVVEMFRLVTLKQRKAALKITLLSTIEIFCVTRAVFLFVNPYGSTGIINAGITRLLFAIGNPCVISALSLLLLVLIDTTKMNIAPPKFQRIQNIVPVIIFHVILVIATDFVVEYFLAAKGLILVCQLYYIIVGLFLTVGFARVAHMISSNVAAGVQRDSKMKKLRRMIILSTVVSALLLTVHLYAAVGVFGIYSHVRHVEAWPWWSFQTCNRFLEVVMCAIVIKLNSNTRTNQKSLLHLLPCYNGNKVETISSNSKLTVTK